MWLRNWFIKHFVSVIHVGRRARPPPSMPDFYIFLIIIVGFRWVRVVLTTQKRGVMHDAGHFLFGHLKESWTPRLQSWQPIRSTTETRRKLSWNLICAKTWEFSMQTLDQNILFYLLKIKNKTFNNCLLYNPTHYFLMGCWHPSCLWVGK